MSGVRWLGIPLAQPPGSALEPWPVLSKMAADKPTLATQMGNQGHSMEGSHRISEIINAGILGKIQETAGGAERVLNALLDITRLDLGVVDLAGVNYPVRSTTTILAGGGGHSCR